MSQRLRIALQKSGRLADKSLELVESAGLRVVKGANELLYRIENAPIDVLRVRDDDIPTFVADGVADFGIVGLNVLAERSSEGERAPEEVMRLGFGRCALKIAAPESFRYEGPHSLDGVRIATSYPGVLRRFLDEHGVGAEIVKMRGAVEVAPRLKLSQVVCDLVSTGATLEANGLAAVETVLESEAVLIRGRRALDPELQRNAESFVDRVGGVVASRGAKYVMMNAPRSALPQISAILPGAGAPTVTPLAGRDDAVAVHAVCQESVFWETLERLKGAGASAILVLPIEKMM
ncbi:MAG: ATP phosphoribosyltransferase [Hyphomonadaceae bacterium]|nr:ATP phosphoribosyltransferase [Hyphomonadaceae bacterium]MBX3510749.1 ATP phosphoribosyltransferase [Hyphomonadaceae bacterium]